MIKHIILNQWSDYDIFLGRAFFFYRSFHVYQHLTSFSHMRGALVGKRTTAAGFHMQNMCDV